MIFINSSPGNALRIFQPFLPIFVPVGIGYLMAMLKQVGIESVCIDEQVEKNIPEKIQHYTERTKPPYIFGFSVLTAAFKNAVELSARIKKLYPDSYIVFGGIHPTAMPDECLSYPQVDIVVRGEAEDIIVGLFRCLKSRNSISHIPGISYRKEGRIQHNACMPEMVSPDSLPAFPYGLFQNKRYDFGFVMSSRGCPHNCFFCSNKISSRRRFRFRPAEKVIEDLSLLYHKYHRSNIYFIDDNMLANHERITDLCHAINSSGLAGKMIFNFQARGDNSDPEILKTMYMAGFRGVYFGIETASETLMKTVNKGETVAQVIEAIRSAKDIGYHVSGNYIFGLPGETHQDRIQAIKLTKKLTLDLVKYNNATPYPGTEFYEHAKMEGRLNIRGLYENINSVSTFIENPFKRIPFAYVPEGSNEKELRQDILHGYFSFYFNVAKTKGVLARHDLNNAWFDFGHSMGDRLKKFPALMLLAFFLSVKFSAYLLKRIFNKSNG